MKRMKVIIIEEITKEARRVAIKHNKSILTLVCLDMSIYFVVHVIEEIFF
jgi:hypothetical protein